MYKEFINSPLLNVSMIKYVKLCGFCNRIYENHNDSFNKVSVNSDEKNNDDEKLYLKVNRISVNKDENSVVVYLTFSDFIIYEKNKETLIKQENIPVWLFLVLIKYTLYYLHETFNDDNYMQLTDMISENEQLSVIDLNHLQISSTVETTILERYFSILNIYLKNTQFYISFYIKTSTLDLIIKDILFKQNDIDNDKPRINDGNDLESNVNALVEGFPSVVVKENVFMRKSTTKYQNKILLCTDDGLRESGFIVNFKTEQYFVHYGNYNTKIYSDIIDKDSEGIQLFVFGGESIKHKLTISRKDLLDTILLKLNMKLTIENELLVITFIDKKEMDFTFDHDDFNIVLLYDITQKNYLVDASPGSTNSEESADPRESYSSSASLYNDSVLNLNEIDNEAIQERVEDKNMFFLLDSDEYIDDF